VSSRVLPEHAEDLQAWFRRLGEAVAAFPGHRGTGLLRPQGTEDRYVTMLTFASEPDLDRWTRSAQLARLLEEVAPWRAEPVVVTRATGLEAWFDLPGAPGAPRPALPPRWKQAMLTWVVITPLVVVLQRLSRGPLRGWPELPRNALLGVAMVCLLTFVLMPALSRLLRPWLLAGR